MRGLHAIAETDPDRSAIVTPDDETVTFGDLSERVNRLSAVLQSLGLQPERVVASLHPNGADHLMAELGVTQLPLYFTPINWKLAVDEIVHILTDSGAELLLVDADRAADGIRAAEAAGWPEGRVLATGTGRGPLPDGARDLDALLDEHPDAPVPTGETGQRMLYTSGTTGAPKGVRRPLPGKPVAEVLETLDYRARVYGMDHPDGVHFATGPLYHSAPGAYATHSLHLGHTVVVNERFDPEDALGRIERYGVTTGYMVPTMFSRLLALPEATRNAYDTTSVRSIVHTAAPCPPHVKSAMIDWLGPVLYEVYGGTEGSATVVSSDEWLTKPGTVGRARQGVSIRILSADGEDQPPNEPGTIYIHNPAMEFRYLGDTAKTDAAFVDGYFTVGDIGYLDDDGYLFLCDRVADVIISGGVNIYPAEVEAALSRHDAVADAAVVGIPDDEWGEQVRAFVAPRPDVVADDDLAEDIIEFCRTHIARFKAPRTVRFVDEIPRSEAGKIQRRSLRDDAWERVGRRL